MVKLELRAVYQTRRWWRFRWPMKLAYTPFLITQWGIVAIVYPIFICLAHFFEMPGNQKTSRLSQTQVEIDVYDGRRTA